MIEGPERAEGYARSTLPGNRWELGWDIFKTNTGKLVGLNLLMLLFFLPVLALVLLRYLQVNYLAYQTPFSQNLGLGYPAFPTMAGLTEYIYLSANFQSFMFLPLAAAIAAVGLSGGMYCMRNFVWAEGVSVGSDFWSGVKKNFWQIFFVTIAYSVIMFLSIMSISYSDFLRANGSTNWLLVASNVISYFMALFCTIVFLFALTLSVTYKLKFTHLIRNSFIMAIALIPLNLFFAAFALVSIILLMLGGIFATLGGVLFVLFGFSLFALVWTNYSQWAFDKFINDKVPGAVKNRGIYSKNAEENEADFSFERSTLGKRHIKPITDYDVEIAALPESFSRADLQRLEESKAAMRQDSDAYSATAAKEEAEREEAEKIADQNAEKENNDKNNSDDINKNSESDDSAKGDNSLEKSTEEQVGDEQVDDEQGGEKA